jgi:nucleotide-binding universal stress UspA family protein
MGDQQMTTGQPKHIICAVRGGPESRETVTRAIELALENNAQLTFLHVIDAEFLEYATIGPLSVVYSELIEMSRFAMLILCDRARRRGVSQVDFIVRDGNIRKQLHKFAMETRAEVMVMGRPTRSPGRNIFKTADFEAFVAELEQNGNLSVIQVTPAPSSQQ